MSDGKRAVASVVGVTLRGDGVRMRNAGRVQSGNSVRSIWFAGVALALAGCAGAPQERAFDPKLAEKVDTAASQAAVAKPGTRVCRWVQLGISERDLVSGVVQHADGNNLRVRIDDPGRFPKSLNGHPVGKGELLTDAANAWTPCKS